MGENLGRVTALRPVLLSAPYGPAEGNLEVALHLPSGLRTTGLVEVTTESGLVGLGEGYLAVFAPKVFVAIAELLAPLVVGRDLGDLPAIIGDLEVASGYWSAEGAARHVLSAIEIALQDARAQALGLPLWRALGGTAARALPVYASGGDARDPAHMAEEIAAVAATGARLFKIRARPAQAAKALWCARAAAAEGIAIAVDMTQNLARPSATTAAIAGFLWAHSQAGVPFPAFLEEIQGPDRIDRLPGLRPRLGVPVAGGETVTTPGELARRIAAGCYDIAQPDATVIGGVGPVLAVFAAARAVHAAVYVHCWGSGVGMLANYHAALAGGGSLVEWPMPSYPLRAALLGDLVLTDGAVRLPETPGLGARLTAETEARYPFRDEAVYRCLAPAAPAADWG